MHEQSTIVNSKTDKHLKLISYTLFGLVAVGIALAIAYFNGYISWPGQQGLPENMYEAAIAEFKIAVELEPGNPEGYRWLSKAYLMAGNKEDATAIYQQAVSNNPDNAWPLVDWGQYYLEQGQVDEAIAQFQQAIELEPDYPDAYTYLAQAYQQSDTPVTQEELLSLYRQVAETTPEESWPYVELGNTYLAGGDVEPAIEAYREAIAAEPNNAEIHKTVGDIYRGHLNQLDQALAHYRQAVALEPDSAWYRAVLGPALFEINQPEEGQRELDLAIRLGGQHSLIQQTVADATLEHRSAEAAEPYYQEAVRLDPLNARAHLGLARVYRRQQDYAQALNHAKEAVSLQNQDVVGDAYLEQGFIYSDMKENDKALVQFSRAINTVPSNPWYQTQVGNFYMNQLKQPEEAIAYYRRAQELAPYNPWYHTFLGRALLVSGQETEGFSALDTALSLTEDDARIYLSFGGKLAENKQWETVVKLYEQALAQGIDDNADIYQSLGDAYRMLNTHEKALVYYRQAAALAATNSSENQ